VRPTLVTGAAGFLGGRVVEALLARGEAVRALDVVAPEGGVAGPVDWIAASVLDAAALARAAAGTAAVIHCAANAQLWARDAETFDRVNHGGTVAAAAAARAAGARLVLVSSFTTLVARGARPGATLDETAEHPPEALLGPYPRAKRRAEIAALETEGLDAVAVLPTAPIGAGGRALTPPMALLRDIARGALPATLDAPINVVPASAVAAGIVAARDHGARGRRYLLAGEDLALGAFAARVAAQGGGRARPG